MAELIIMRHAESVLSKNNKYSGVLDIPLSEAGIKQAAEVVASIPEINFDLVYVSTLLRSLETALIILAFKKAERIPIKISETQISEYFKTQEYLPILEYEVLRERHYGIFQGLSKVEINNQFDSKTIFKWRRSIDKAPPGGESLNEIIKRVRPFLKKKIIPYLEADKNLLIVAHQSTIRALFYIIFKPSITQIEGLEFENASILHIRYTKKEFSLINKVDYGNIDNNQAKGVPYNGKIVKVAAYISAAGKGSRMLHLTKKNPKPLLKIDGKPLISNLLDSLYKQNVISKVYVSYGHLKERWNHFISTCPQERTEFLLDKNFPNLISALTTNVKKINEDVIVVISGDMIFDFAIIENVLKKHIYQEHLVTVCLNNSKDNLYKYWDYKVSNGVLLDIVKQENISNIERYFFIINRTVLSEYTNDFEINMGFSESEFEQYALFNNGWTCLLKKLLDNKIKINALFLYEKVINVNSPNNFEDAKFFLLNHGATFD